MDGCGDDIAYVPAWWMRVFSRLYLEVVAGVEILSDTSATSGYAVSFDTMATDIRIMELIHRASLMHMTTRVLGYALLAVYSADATACSVFAADGTRMENPGGGDSGDGLFGGSPPRPAPEQWLRKGRAVPVWVKTAFGIVVVHMVVYIIARSGFRCINNMALRDLLRWCPAFGLASTTCAVPYSVTCTISVILCMVGIANWVMHTVSGNRAHTRLVSLQRTPAAMAGRASPPAAPGGDGAAGGAGAAAAPHHRLSAVVPAVVPVGMQPMCVWTTCSVPTDVTQPRRHAERGTGAP
eukprot:gene37337-61135_t